MRVGDDERLGARLVREPHPDLRAADRDAGELPDGLTEELGTSRLAIADSQDAMTWASAVRGAPNDSISTAANPNITRYIIESSRSERQITPVSKPRRLRLSGVLTALD